MSLCCVELLLLLQCMSLSCMGLLLLMLKHVSLSCVSLLLLRVTPSRPPVLPINRQLNFTVGTEALISDHRLILLLA